MSDYARLFQTSYQKNINIKIIYINIGVFDMYEKIVKSFEKKNIRPICKDKISAKLYRLLPSFVEWETRDKKIIVQKIVY